MGLVSMRMVAVNKPGASPESFFLCSRSSHHGDVICPEALIREEQMLAPCS